MNYRGQVIGRSFIMLNLFAVGCLEKAHENALAHELRAAGLNVVWQLGGTKPSACSACICSHLRPNLVSRATGTELSFAT
jgi:hypothetical protein